MLCAFDAHCALRSLAETIQCASVLLQCIHDIESRDGLPACMLRVGHRIPDDVLQEHLQHAARLIIYEAAQPLDTASSCKTPNGGCGDALDVISQGASVAYRTALAVALAALAASRHVVVVGVVPCGGCRGG